MSSLSNFIGGKPYNTNIQYAGLKPSIVLFDCNPGTRSWTVPEGVTSIRAFVVGAGGSGDPSAGGMGGGYSEKVIAVFPGQVINYTVGAPAANSSGLRSGTSSLAGVISATGGTKQQGGGILPGQGSGGDINSDGGMAGTTELYGGGAGHAFGAGQPGGFNASPIARVDGWKLGMLPGPGMYGSRGTQYTPPGMGGGGYPSGPQVSIYNSGGIGGGSAPYGQGGPGLVGIEVIA